MRRLILIFMMCLLPLQWSWAVAGSVCEHETGNAHFGHHEHQHHGSDDGVSHDTDSEKTPDASGNHPDCQVCHGLGAAFAQDTEAGPAVWTARGGWPAYRGVLPEPPIESLLRPPLTLVA